MCFRERLQEGRDKLEAPHHNAGQNVHVLTGSNSLETVRVYRSDSNKWQYNRMECDSSCEGNRLVINDKDKEERIIRVRASGMRREQ